MKCWLFSGLALAAILIVGGWLVYRGVFSNEELASKVEWSIVQAVVAQHDDKSSDKIEIVKLKEYSLVGIPVKDARKEVWILLNPETAPYYKQLPKGNYTLSKEDLKRVLASGVVSSSVENCLESHVEDAK